MGFSSTSSETLKDGLPVSVSSVSLLHSQGEEWEIHLVVRPSHFGGDNASFSERGCSDE